MSGIPIIPITFFGKARKLSDTEFAVAPVDQPEEVIEYVTNSDVPILEFRASPPRKDEHHANGDSAGEKPSEGSAGEALPPERSGDGESGTPASG